MPLRSYITPSVFLLLGTLPWLAYAQLVTTPAIPVAGESVTITALAHGDEDYYFQVQGLDSTSYFNSGYNCCSFTVSNLGVGYYQALADPGSNDLPYNPDVYFAVVQPGLSAVSSIQGMYAFLCHATSQLPGGQQAMAASIGSFTADGTGKITAGTLDENSAVGVLLNQALTGTYSLDSTGAGELIFNTQAGTTSFTLQANPEEITDGGRLLNGTFAGSVAGSTTGNCSLAYQNGGLYVSYGAYLLQLSGEHISSGSSSGPIAIYGQATLGLNGDNTSAATVSEFSGSTAIRNVPLTGTFSVADPVSQRSLISLSGAGEAATAPKHFVAYPFNPQAAPSRTKIYLMSIDSHTATDLVIGQPPL